jgi:hypothetical protein
VASDFLSPAQFRKAFQSVSQNLPQIYRRSFRATRDGSGYAASKATKSRGAGDGLPLGHAKTWAKAGAF